MFQSLSIGGSTPTAQTLVFGHFQGEALDDATRTSAKALGFLDFLSALAARSDSTGDAGTLTEHVLTATKKGPQRLMLVGLGKKASFEPGSMRTIAAAIGRKLAALKLTSAAIDLSGPINTTKGGKASLALSAQAFGEGLGLLSWVCDTFKGTGTADPKRVKLAVTSSDAAFTAAMKRGLALAQATNLTRTLSQTPPNIATPAWMAEQAKKVARIHGLTCTVMSGATLVKEKMIGHLAVGNASENKPCIIRLEYTPKGPKKNKNADKPIVLIGKTVTYDTGGLSLKINNGMVGMKRDKDGGCAVLGAMMAIASTIKPKRRVVAFLAAAENSISDEAFRPDDILRYRNNVTVEVTNTDAEGRLVLADALCWACEKENPSYIVDLATLTGGVVVALGSTFCGMFCEDDRLRGKIEAAAAASGERVWRLPMHQEYKDMMKSPVADIVNSNPNRKAHPVQGAAFLSYFVDDKIPWCHLDIAGVHVAEKNAGPYIEGPMGWGVRLLASLVEMD
jgi:leucyl aminopeptidase